ncbi:MAG: hypothetical protein K2M31_09425 [Muribaculaceae bacterium]|nr:hypothetical protein [Muribaculaceae bacterium]
MAKIKFYLDCRRVHSDGTSPLVIVLTHQFQRRFFNLEMNLRKEDWDKSKSQLKPHAYRAALLNAKLDRIIALGLGHSESQTDTDIYIHRSRK